MFHKDIYYKQFGEIQVMNFQLLYPDNITLCIEKLDDLNYLQGTFFYNYNYEFMVLNNHNYKEYYYIWVDQVFL